MLANYSILCETYTRWLSHESRITKIYWKHWIFCIKSNICNLSFSGRYPEHFECWHPCAVLLHELQHSNSFWWTMLRILMSIMHNHPKQKWRHRIMCTYVECSRRTEMMWKKQWKKDIICITEKEREINVNTNLKHINVAFLNWTRKKKPTNKRKKPNTYKCPLFFIIQICAVKPIDKNASRISYHFLLGYVFCLCENLLFDILAFFSFVLFSFTTVNTKFTCIGYTKFMASFTITAYFVQFELRAVSRNAVFYVIFF